MTMPLLEALKTLRNMAVSGNVPFALTGICNNLWRLSACEDCEMKALFSNWHLDSGYSGFPIPGGHDFYLDTKNIHRNLWQGDQLNYRLSLINHMINKIEGIV